MQAAPVVSLRRFAEVEAASLVAAQGPKDRFRGEPYSAGASGDENNSPKAVPPKTDYIITH